MANEYIDKVKVGAKIQMMYIRREMDYGGENDFCRGMRKALRVIDNMPASDVQPIRRGRWILKSRQISDVTVKLPTECTNCGFSEFNAEKYKFCPNCGARMDGEQK